MHNRCNTEICLNARGVTVFSQTENSYFCYRTVYYIVLRSPDLFVSLPVTPFRVG